ncbi:MAG: GDSL-type esterase/lipase family protein [bacterium]|nr:GDSL-type esterase/lipase family protein [bacterium]
MNSKKLLLFNLFTLGLLLAIMVKEHYPQKVWHYFKKKPEVKDEKIQYWLNRDQLFEALPHDSNSIVFIGTSLTENFELNEIFKNCAIKNRGITSDVTEGILNRLNPVILDQPKKIFLEAGINDLGKGYTSAQLVANYKLIIEKLQKACPNTQLFLQSILPVANKGQYPTYNNPQINAAIVTVNSQLKALALAKNVTYIELYNSFVINNELNSKYVIQDGIHLNGEAYKLWAELLKPYL